MQLKPSFRSAIGVALVALAVLSLSMGVFAKPAKHVDQNQIVNNPVIDASGGPDAFGYVWRDNNNEPTGPVYSWIDMSAATQLTITLGDSDDGESAPIALPFAFPFYGVNRSHVIIHTNGFMTFDTTFASTAWTNATIPTAATPNALVSGFWDDLVSPNIRYGLNGGNFVVSYIQSAGYNAPTDTVSFQMILSPNGTIVYQYRGLVATFAATSTVGIENDAGTAGLLVAFNAPYVAAGRAVRFSLPVTNNYVYGNVTAFTGNTPVDGVTVTCGARTATTNALGYYRVQTSTGMQQLSFVKDGWITKLDSVNVATDSVRLDAQLRHPVLVVLPTSLTLNVTVPDSATGTISVNNTGDAALNYTASLGNAVPWSVYRNVNVDSSVIRATNYGVEFFQGYLWVSDANKFFRFNPDGSFHDSSITIAGAAATGFTVRDMCNDGTYIYGSWDRTIRAFNATTGANVATMNINLANVGTAATLPLGRGLAYDPTDSTFYVSNWGGTATNDTIFKINRAGVVLRRYGGNPGVGGLAFHPEDPDGYKLWTFGPGVAGSSEVKKINTTNGDMMPVQIPMPGADPAGSSAGCGISDQIIPGNWVFFALTQGAPDRVMMYPIGTTRQWSVTPTSGVISAGGTRVFTVKYRTRANDASTTINTALNLNWVTDMVTTIPITVNVNGVSAREVSNPTPNTFALLGAYPNPFNPTTTVKFSVGTRSNVKLALYDINGRMVTEVFQGELPAGTHSIGLKAVELSSGTYFLRMSAGSYTGVSKVVFLK